MQLDLKKVPIREIEFHGIVNIEKKYYEKTGVLDVKNVDLEFSITKDANQDEVFLLHSKGIFLLEDARTLEPVEYPFEIHLKEKLTIDSEFYDRFLINSQNTLDILAILWENIVLEIPISYTVAEDLKSTNETYRIIGEESIEKVDPRLAPLLELLDKEKE